MKNRIVSAFLSLAAAAGLVAAHPLAAQTGSPLVGYAVVGPGSGISSGVSELLVFRTFGFRQGLESEQSETPAAQMTTSALLFISTSALLERNVGIAIANPGTPDARLDLTLRRDDGIVVALKTIFIPPRQQISQFVTEIFADQSGVPAEFTGTLSITSSIPVAVVAMRFRGSAFTTEPPSELSSPTPVPEILPGVGANGSFILPNFVSGGGWATQIVLVNTSATDVTARLDLFSSGGVPLNATLNGVTGSTFFDLRIRAHGVLVLASPSGQF